MAFTVTSFLGLFKPQKGARGWANAVNLNFDTIDDAIKTLASNSSPSFQDAEKGIVIFESESSKSVSLNTEMTGEYAVLLTPGTHVTFWVTTKTSSGFTINIGTTFTGSIDWFAVKI